MKKFLLSIGLLAASSAFAQLNWKFEPTDYRGAFAPAPTPMWTNGWTNFDPQTTVYPAPTVTVSANITANTTWSSSSVYLLSGPIYVTNNATLTIQPGTVIRGNAAATGSALIITKGAKIIADGTLAQPIVFTSSAAPGSRAIGDWGGIVVLGKASNNLPANATAGTPAGIGNIEGLPVSANSEFGGGATPDDNDYSGILRYIRLEFGGYAYQIDKEINGFTFGSVGAATVAEYLQTSFVNDDAFEWFGGTMNAKYLVAYRCLDDDMDCDFGYRGKVQFGLIVRDPNIADQSSGSTSEGFECDNDGAGSTNTPKTAAMFSNFTAIGPLRGNPSATINSKFERALRLRRNSEMKILNSIFMDWKRGIHIDGTAAEARAGEDALRFRNNIIAGCQPSNKIVTTSATFNTKKYVADNMNDTLISAAGILVNPYNYTAPDYRPAAGSIALTNADFNDQGFPQFTATAFRGAFAPAPVAMWTDSWTNFDPANTIYPNTTVTVSANITVDTRWTANNTYLLSGPIYVNNNATLTIEPGTVIRGNKAIAGSALVITKGAKLIANGTKNAPIVFTSSGGVGNRAIGDWGGIVILGKAANNLPANATAGTAAGIGNIEGLPVSPNSEYGGGATPNDNDNSGILKYVRIEFGGYAYQIDKEINGLTMGSVGRSTVIDYVQTSYTNDDSFEWFGGTVNAKHLVAYRGLDDDMDCDFGYRGQIQYVLVVRDPAIADQSSGSTSEGFECDNDGSGSTNSPKTAATFSNVTAVGPLRGNVNATIDLKHERALRLRKNSEMKIHNSIFMDFKKGLFIDGATTEAQATGGNLLFKNNILAGYRPNNGFFKTSASFDIKTFFATNANDSLTSSANILTTPYNYTAPDYRPAVGSLALTGAAFTAAPFAGNVACGLAAPSVSGSLSVCQGSSSTLSAPAGFTYLWSTGATTQTINVTAAGNYTVTITDGIGCSNSSTVAVSVNTRPTVTVSGSATVCAGQSVTLTAVGGATYLWNTGVTTNTLTVTPSANTTYSVIGTNVAGCSDTATFSVVVDAIPTMSGTPTITNAGCGLSNGSITGVSIVGTGLTYNWTNSANVSVGTTADLSNVPAGVYNLTATKATGCSAAFGPYSISNPTAPAAATVTVVDSVLCAGETIQMTAASTTTGATFSWSGPNFTGSGATVTITNATAANAGVYSVTVTDNGCTSASSNKSVVVNNLPAVTVLTFTDTTCVNYSNVTLAGAPTGGTFSGSGVTGASFDPAVAGVGTHVVTYAYTDANGCSNTATTSIVVDACVGLGESAINSIRVFPNPTNTVINVASTREDIAVVVLTNSVGEVVARVRGTQLDASQFANGLYFVTAIFEDGSSAVGRVTILN
ncbi:MAG: T9SS type A sorting domain-containing protein [Cryomorphaceae bacterium]|nr:T9SS type A sorting domain-containing protein [Cryomorphaceae bacterium]